MSYINFKDDPSTKTDDFLYKAAAINELIHAFAGILTFTGTLIVSYLVMINPNIPEVTKNIFISGNFVGGTTLGLSVSKTKLKAGKNSDNNAQPSKANIGDIATNVQTAKQLLDGIF